MFLVRWYNLPQSRTFRPRIKSIHVVINIVETSNYKKIRYVCGILRVDVLYLPVMVPIIPDAFCLRDDAVLLLPLFVILPPPVILLPPVLFAPPLNMLDAFCFSGDVKA